MTAMTEAAAALSAMTEHAMLVRKAIRIAASGAMLGLGLVAAGYGTAGTPGTGRAPDTQAHPITPSSVVAEHRHLHRELANAIGSGGRTAAEAKKVDQLLQPHFAKEERFALAPLAALPDLASGRVPPNAAEIVRMSASLQSGMPAMLAEHHAIGEALERLRLAARDERKPQAAKFAEDLKAHAQHEEDILYPAAILAGHYLKLKLGQH
jgi:hypothetical protein